jgi:hypothetical protein
VAPLAAQNLAGAPAGQVRELRHLLKVGREFGQHRAELGLLEEALPRVAHRERREGRGPSLHASCGQGGTRGWSHEGGRGRPPAEATPLRRPSPAPSGARRPASPRPGLPHLAFEVGEPIRPLGDLLPQRYVISFQLRHALPEGGELGRRRSRLPLAGAFSAAARGAGAPLAPSQDHPQKGHRRAHTSVHTLSDEASRATFIALTPAPAPPPTRRAASGRPAPTARRARSSSPASDRPTA